MFCIKCGSELAEGAVFCSKCGTKVDSDNVNKVIAETGTAVDAVTVTSANATVSVDTSVEKEAPSIGIIETNKESTVGLFSDAVSLSKQLNNNTEVKKEPLFSKSFKYTLIAIFAVFAIFCISQRDILFSGNSASREEKVEEKAEDKAMSYAKALISEKLKDPSSVTWNSVSIAETDNHGRYLVRLDYTSTNGFGGRVREKACVALMLTDEGAKYSSTMSYVPLGKYSDIITLAAIDVMEDDIGWVKEEETQSSDN